MWKCEHRVHYVWYGDRNLCTRDFPYSVLCHGDVKMQMFVTVKCTCNETPEGSVQCNVSILMSLTKKLIIQSEQKFLVKGARNVLPFAGSEEVKYVHVFCHLLLLLLHNSVLLYFQDKIVRKSNMSMYSAICSCSFCTIQCCSPSKTKSWGSQTCPCICHLLLLLLHNSVLLYFQDKIVQ